MDEERSDNGRRRAVAHRIIRLKEGIDCVTLQSWLVNHVGRLSGCQLFEEC